MDNIIIHISGASGCGKTTFGNKLKKTFKNKIIVKDLDILRDKHIEKTYDTTQKWNIDEKKYQKYIDDFIKKQNKPIIFVGLNDNILGNKKLYYDLHSKYNFYIDIDDKIILRQKFLRLLKDLPNDIIAMKDLVDNNKKFVENIKWALNETCNLDNLIKMNNKWKKDYKKQNYKFMSIDDIYKKIKKILK